MHRIGGVCRYYLGNYDSSFGALVPDVPVAYMTRSSPADVAGVSKFPRPCLRHAKDFV
jgi:hypothetical protein